jgi:Cu-Zn family superoxide dismutase
MTLAKISARYWLAAIAALATMAGAATAVADPFHDHGHGYHMGYAVAALSDKDGMPIGRVVLRFAGHRVVVSARFQGLTPGFHGFHIHTVGKCEPMAKDATGAVVPFSSAGGHLDVGMGAMKGPHAGDLPPLLADSRGRATATFTTDRFTLRDLMDADGSAIIVHAGPDNLGNIPPRYTATGSTTPGPDAMTLATGDSGPRVACGVISAPGVAR